MRAFVDWGVLLETNEKGIYRGASKRVIDDMLLVIWVIKAILVARGEKSQLLSGTLRGPHLFPFDIAPPPIRELKISGAEMRLLPWKYFSRDSPDGSSQLPTMVAQWASDRESGPELAR